MIEKVLFSLLVLFGCMFSISVYYLVRRALSEPRKSVLSDEHFHNEEAPHRFC
jgi:hypothetical protein